MAAIAEAEEDIKALTGARFTGKINGAFIHPTTINLYSTLLFIDVDKLDFQPIPFTYRDYVERDGFSAEVLKEGVEIV